MRILPNSSTAFRKSSSQGSIAVVVVILAIVGIIGALVWYLSHEPMPAPTPQIHAAGKASTTDLVSFSIHPGETVSGVMSATGSIKGAYFFEGNILVNIVDANEVILRAGHGTATTDWMTNEPVSFSTDLDFTGLLPGAAFIAIQNDNPSDMRENDKILYIPIVIR